MKKSEAKVGVRVRVKGNTVGGRTCSQIRGLEGTIRKEERLIFEIGVEFDRPVEFGHNLEGMSKDGCGRFGFLREFEVIKPKKATKKKGGLK